MTYLIPKARDLRDRSLGDSGFIFHGSHHNSVRVAQVDIIHKQRSALLLIMS